MFVYIEMHLHRVLKQWAVAAMLYTPYYYACAQKLQASGQLPLRFRINILFVYWVLRNAKCSISGIAKRAFKSNARCTVRVVKWLYCSTSVPYTKLVGQNNRVITAIPLFEWNILSKRSAFLEPLHQTK